MTNDEPKFLNALNELFANNFAEAYKNTKMRGKGRILKNSASMFKRWSYTTLVGDTLISPANLFFMINRQYGRPPLRTPVIRPRGTDAFRGFDFGFIDYSLDRHPIVKDLRTFVESCFPDIQLDNNDLLLPEHMEALMKRLSLWDPYYVEYLLLLCVHMNIVKKIPSIYSNRAIICAGYEAKLSRPDREILNEIVDITVEITTTFLSGVLPLPKSFVNTQFVTSLLKEPMPTDEIFRSLYDSIDVRLEEIMTFEIEDNYEELGQALMSSTFFLGIILDKYFFTPFGHYLKFIRPLYALTYDFEEEMAYIMESADRGEGIPAAIYAPCSNYYLTELGLEFFEVEPNSDNFCAFYTKLPLETIMRLAINNSNPAEEDYRQLNEDFRRSDWQSSTIYEIKIKHQNNKVYWKNMEFPSNITLHSLFSEICFEFNLDMSSDYSFFADTTENKFSQYTSNQHPRRAKKTHSVTLADLNFEANHRFLLTVYNTYDPLAFEFNSIPVKVLKLELEILRVKQRSVDRLYPRVSRTSQAFRELESEWE